MGQRQPVASMVVAEQGALAETKVPVVVLAIFEPATVSMIELL